MESSLKDIIKEIGKEYNLKEETIDSYIEILTNQFYLKLKDIKNISENEWRSFGLPLNFYHLVKEKYESALNENKKNLSSSQALNSILNLSAPCIQIDYDEKIEEIIFNDLFLLFQQVNNEKTLKEILKQIYRVINNIIENPGNAQFKRINIHNFLTKYNYQMIETFFIDIKFQKEDKHIYFKGDNEYIKSVMSEFIKFLKDNNIDSIIDNNLYNKAGNNGDIKMNNEGNNKSENKEDNKTENKKDNKVNVIDKGIENTIDNTINITLYNKIDKNKDNSIYYKLDNKLDNATYTIKDDKISSVENKKNNSILDDKETKPLNGSTLIDDSSNIKLYLYPKIVFNTEEENNSKVILLIGQTGDGKTTFLNALVNIYSGIKIGDNFRYLLVNDKDNFDEKKSKTKEVTIYNIRPKKGLNFPPIKIVDTPGFGDTNGIDEDKEHLKKLKKAFDEELIFVHSICFIVNCTKCRIDFHQKYVFNTLIGLFAENVKDIFIVGVTHFFQESNEDLPNIIKSYLSLEDSFYFKCILEKVDILNSYWYFASDNRIIINNRIERNDIQIYKWEQTEKIIKFYLENKIKDSQGVEIKETKEVIQKRIDVSLQIDILEKNLKELIDIKRSFIDDQRKEENYLKEISEKEEIILKHQKEKEKAEKNMETIQVLMENLFDEDELNEMAKKFNSEGNYIDMIDNVTEALKDKVDILKREKLRTKNNIFKNEVKISSNEIEFIRVLNQIKLNFDYLRKNSLNKDYSKSVESYLNELIGETTDLEKKRDLEKLRKIYSHLIEVENIDVNQLTNEKYQEIKNKMIDNN